MAEYSLSYDLQVDEIFLQLTCFMRELIPNIFIRVCIKMNVHNFISLWHFKYTSGLAHDCSHENDGTSIQSHAFFQTICTNACLGV